MFEYEKYVFDSDSEMGLPQAGIDIDRPCPGSWIPWG